MRGNTVTMLLEKGSIARSEELFQYDYGQRLILDGVELPAAYEVHFSNKERGESKTSIGDSTGVDIPDEYLQSGENIHVWLYLHDGEDDGETEYHGIISVHKRAKPTNAEPTPVQQDVITQTIAALNDAVEEAEGIAAEIPETISQALQEAKDSGEFDGFSPTANVVKEGHVATITITDKEGTTTATVEDGSAAIIDDDAGAGVKDKTWSADKITAAIGDINSFDIEIVQTLPQTGDEHTIYFVPKTGSQGDSYDEYLYLNGQWEMIGTTDVDVSTKADKTDTVLLTTLSRGRRSGTTVGGNSFAFGQDVTASANNTHAEGYNTRATGAGAHAEGGNTTASGQYSHAEGENATASGLRSHAEGYITTASGSYSHAEGYGTVGTGALGKADHAEGYQTTANSGAVTGVYGAHAEGRSTQASADAAHAEGNGSVASGNYSHAEGVGSIARGTTSHAEGTSTASGMLSHSEGNGTASGNTSHAEGMSTASGMFSHAEGTGNASGMTSHAEGVGTASGMFSHAEGSGTTASGNCSHAGGANTIANSLSQSTFGEYNVADPGFTSAGSRGTYVEIVGNGTATGRSNARTLDWQGNERLMGDLYVHCNADGTGGNALVSSANPWFTGSMSMGRASDSVVGTNSTAFGNGVRATGANAHAEGGETQATGANAHAEGGGTTASGVQAHAEGGGTQATGANAHAEGGGTQATGSQSHAEGTGTQATGQGSHAEGGGTIASGDASHAEGGGTIANGPAMHAEGQYNVPATNNEWAHVVGNGTSSNRSNAYALDWDGTGHFAGDVYVNCNDDSTGGNKVAAIDDTAGAGDTDVTFSADKLTADHSSLMSAINGKQDAPETAGTAGQVLGLDSNLDPVWVNQQGGGGGAVDDVQINGTSIVSSGVANIPIAGQYPNRGVVTIYPGYGLSIRTSGTYAGMLQVNTSSDNQIKSGSNDNVVTVPANQHKSVFYGLAKAAGDSTQAASSNPVGTYTEDAKSSISEMLNGAVSVSGTTPTITALPGVRYICGQVDTLTIVVPSSGCIDVTFESGSTPTVLTITPPSGMTMKWANGFDPTALEANTTYEINILDGCLGVAGSWT